MSFANALRTLKALAQSVTTQIGVGLAAALRHVIIFLREAMKHVLGLAQTFANFMQTLFGKYQGGAKGFAMEGLGDADEYANDLADATGDAASGLGDMADNAEQLRKELSVLPFDELNQLNKDREATTSSGGNGGTGGSGGGGLGDLGLGDVGLGLEDFLEGSELPEAISKWGKRIRDAFLKHDWAGLGSTVAEMFNEGIQFLYDLLDPEKVKKKVDPYIDAFTTAFNSFVDIFNFELLGKTIARGINDIAYIFNSWYSKMNFENLGVKLSEGLNGLLVEGDFYEWGLALGNKFMIGWDIFAGFVSNEQMWHNLGQAIADGIKGLTAGIRLGKIGKALSDFINGICETLETIAEDDEMWSGVVDNIVDGINTFIGNTEWKEDGEKLNKFLQKFADALSETIDNIHWYELGQGLGQTLTEIKFGQAIKKLASSIVNALGDFLKGLISEPGGKVALGIIGGLAAIKLAIPVLVTLFNIGLGKTIARALAESIAKNIAKESFGKTVAESVAKGGATSGGGGLLAALFPSVAAGGGLVGLTLAAKKLSEVVEVARGGNGVLTTFGTAVDSVTQSLIDSRKISEEERDEIFRLKEAGEEAGKSQEQIASEIIAKLGEYGVSADSAKRTVEGLTIAGNNEADALSVLSAAADAAIASGEGLNGTQLQLNGTMPTTQQAIKDIGSALYDTMLYSTDLQGEYQGVLDGFRNTSSSATSAQEAYGMVENMLEELGIDTTDFKNRLSDLGYEFVEVEQQAGTSGANITTSMANGMGNFAPITSKISEIQNTFSTKFEEIKNKTVEAGRQTIQEYGKKYQGFPELTTGLTNITNSVSTALQNVQNDSLNKAKTTISGYGNAWAVRNELNNNLSAMSQHINATVGNIKTAVLGFGGSTISEYGKKFSERTELNNELNTTKSEMDTKFDAIKKAAEDIGTNTRKGIEAGLQTHLTNLRNTASDMVAVAEGAANDVYNIMSNMDLYYAGRSAAQSFSNGFEGVHIATPHMYISGWDTFTWGDGWQSVPTWSIAWYKAGGVFKGGKGQVIGVAEGGRDEAVLPLEDKRAMSRIADSIVDSSGSGMGLNADDIADAVVQAMVMMQGNQQSPVFHIEVKTEDNEVLARAVTKGQQSIDYRNNPTPKFAY